MIFQKLKEKFGQSDESGMFCKGDTLAMSLPSVVDLSIYTVLYQSIHSVVNIDIRYLLLDMSNTRMLCDSGIAAFICLRNLISQQRLRLLMLDTPAHIYNRLELVLPDAFWIDTSDAETTDNAEMIRDLIVSTVHSQ